MPDSPQTYEFNWALKQMLRGREVRRSVDHWDPIQSVAIMNVELVAFFKCSHRPTAFNFSKEDLVAHDWVLVG